MSTARAAPHVHAGERRLAIALGMVLIGSLLGVAACRIASSGGGLGGASGPRLVMATTGMAATADPAGRQAVASDQIDRRLVEASASAGGDVEVSLAWNSLSDIDLDVRDPSQAITDAYHPRTQFGAMDVDANPTPLMRDTQEPNAGDVMPITPDMLGMLNAADSIDQILAAGGGNPLGGADPRLGKVRSIFSLAPVEHIYFAHAPRGTYAVYVRCFWWREPTRTPLPFTVQIRSRGKVFKEVSGIIGPANYVADRVSPTMVCQFEVR